MLWLHSICQLIMNWLLGRLAHAHMRRWTIDKKEDLAHLIRKNRRLYVYAFPIWFIYYYFPYQKPHTEWNCKKQITHPLIFLVIGKWSRTVCLQMIRHWSASHLCHLDNWTCDEGLNWQQERFIRTGDTIRLTINLCYTFATLMKNGKADKEGKFVCWNTKANIGVYYPWQQQGHERCECFVSLPVSSFHSAC